jgi:transcriptional regulator with XRE-family HTH domain
MTIDRSPAAIQAARAAAALTMQQAADLLGLSGKSRWAEWERPRDAKGAREPSLAIWNLFLLLTDQHPEWSLKRREATTS